MAFVAVGAYSLAVGVTEFGLSLWLCIFLGLLVAIVLALILGVPTLRLRADYLAIVTIAASEILRLVLRAASFRDIFGGAAGIQNFADEFYALNPFPEGRYGIGPVDFPAPDFWVLVVGWSLVALLVSVRLPAHAQPVGPGRQGDPRGRGRRPQPGQERLLLQDAEP